MPDVKSELLKKWALSIILIGSFLLSFFYSFYYQIKPAVDARAYDRIAVNIVSGVGYKEYADKDFQHDFALGRVGPLYEYFLAGIYKVFGHDYVFVWFWQAVLHALTAFLVYKICLRVFDGDGDGERVALLSAILVGFHPDLIEISAMLMTETLYLFLFCLMLYVFVSESAWLGVVSGLAVLARPPVLFCLPVIYLFFYNRRAWRQAIIFSVTLALVFVPWTVRNYSIYQRLSPFGVAGQYNFWIGNHVGSQGEQVASQEIFDYIDSHAIMELGDESISQFKNFISERPAEFIKLTAIRTNKYFSFIRPMGFWDYNSGWRQAVFVALSALWGIILFVFGLAGAIKIYLRGGAGKYLVMLAIATPLILLITVVETRYRFQIYPLLAIFAGYFLANFSWGDRELRKLFLISSAVIFVNGGLDLLLNSGKIIEKVSAWL